MKLCVVGLSILFLISACSSIVEKKSVREPASVSSTDIALFINQLMPFQSNGCSKFSRYIAYPNIEKWGLCCVQHDIVYWKGGTSEDRYKADQRLQNCIIEVGEPNIARLVFWGVRAAAVSSSAENDLWHWGYGWKVPRGYAPFSDVEQKQVTLLENKIPTDFNKIELMMKRKSSESATLFGNVCADSSVGFIQNNLSRKFTPLSVSEFIVELGKSSFEYQLSIMTKECHSPYVFTYHLKKKNACTDKQSSSIDSSIILQNIDYPVECN